MTEDLPDKFGHYRVIECLGSGRQGETFLAADPTDRKVAVKTVHAHLADSKETRREFDREVVALRKINTAFRPRYIDYNSVAARPFYVMEYIEGVTLGALIKARGQLDDDQVLRIGVWAAEILVAMHTVGVAHGDFRDQNLILSTSGGIYAVDFGQAKMRRDSREEFDQRRQSDLRQLGELLVKARNGRGPFGDDSSQAIGKFNEGRPDLGALDGRTRDVAAELLQRHPGRGGMDAKRAYRVLLYGRRARHRFWLNTPSSLGE